MTRGGQCEFCGGTASMCAACARAYDRWQKRGDDDGTVIASMSWAAARAVQFVLKIERTKKTMPREARLYSAGELPATLPVTIGAHGEPSTFGSPVTSGYRDSQGNYYYGGGGGGDSRTHSRTHVAGGSGTGGGGGGANPPCCFGAGCSYCDGGGSGGSR